MFFPLVVHAFDLIVSTIGIFIVRTAEERECQQFIAAAPSLTLLQATSRYKSCDEHTS